MIKFEVSFHNRLDALDDRLNADIRLAKRSLNYLMTVCLIRGAGIAQSV
jgi:hypothetical protein